MYPISTDNLLKSLRCEMMTEHFKNYLSLTLFQRYANMGKRQKTKPLEVSQPNSFKNIVVIL
jgi:hypothetical protein